MIVRLFSVFALLLIFVTPTTAQQSNSTVEGIVTDVMDGLPLQGAAVILSRRSVPGEIAGVATDEAGRYAFSNIRPGRYNLIVRYVGYDESRRVVVLNPSQSYTFDIGLDQSSFDLNTIVISASRNEEKVMDAISSISVLTDRELQSDVVPSSAATLRHITGVDLAQTGIDRQEVAIRGFNNAMTGEPYILSDYRLAAIPGMAVNVYGLMPIATLDIDRVEIVRGPGSAAYGAGVDQGLMHFVTKDPFSYPGTSLSASGGERALYDVELRHAGVIPRLFNGRLGYKITGEYAAGEDWQLDPADPLDLNQITIEGGDGRDPDYWRYGVNGALEFRPNNRVRIHANGGYLSQKMALLTGIGTAQTDDFSYAFGQLRIHAGNLFVQAYANLNDSGQSFYYGPTSLSTTNIGFTDKTILLNGQANYNIVTAGGREQILIGVDYKATLPETSGTLHGRNEDIDRVDEIGGFVQSSTVLTQQVDLTAALRVDYNNINQEIRLSPRAGLVFKVTPAHSLRIAANRAFGAPGINQNFLDLNVSTLYTASNFGIALQGRGAHEGFTFNTFREQQTVTFLLPDAGDIQNESNPAFFGTQMSLDQIPLAPVYENFATQLSNVLTNGGELPVDLNRLTANTRTSFAQLLTRLAPFITGTTTGALGLPDASGDGFRFVDAPADVAPLKQPVTNSLEIGYKGVIGERILLAVDAYFTQKKNFIGPLLHESPYVFLPELESEIFDRIAPLVDDFTEADPQLATLLQDIGLSVDETASLIAQLAADGFGSLDGFAGIPVAIVQPDQATLPDGAPSTVIGGLMTYRNFGNVQYWGIDFALEYLLTDRLRVFANTSYVSDGFFDNTELKEDNPDLVVSLNAPTLKVSTGFTYQFPFGFSFSAAGRYVDEFQVNSGPFVGIVEDYAVVDAGMGYDFGRRIPGLRFDVTAQNLLTVVDGKLEATHREFIGAPKIGRLAMARLVYTF